MKNKINKLLLFPFHLLAIIFVIVAFVPLAIWYFNAQPLWGVDFFYTASLANLLKQSFVLPPAGWGYAWFGGWPLLSNYPIMHLYFIVPLISIFGLISSVKIWMLASFVFFFIGLYSIFYFLSKNIIISVLLTISAVYSVSVYGSLMWGGSLPNHATQAFYPWAVFFVLYYLRNKNFRSLLIAAVITGLSILGHPQVPIAYIYPTVFILFATSWGNIKIKKRIVSFLIFFGVTFLVGLPILYSTFGGALSSLVVTNSTEVASSTVRIDSEASRDIQAFHHRQPYRIYEDNNKVIFFLSIFSAVFFVISFIFAKSKKDRILRIIPFVALAIYYVIYIWIFAYGISMYHGGWYRLFWSVPIWLGMLTACFWGEAQDVLVGYFKSKRHIAILKPAFIAFLGIVATVPAALFFFSTTKNIKEEIVARSTPSSAFPDVINLRSDEDKFRALKEEMLPSWIDGDNTNYRMYDGDQTINIWWSSLYKMPLARGYLDPPFKNRGYLFWLDAALSQEAGTGKDQLEGNFNIPAELSLNNTLFLIDWYSVKYLEGGKEGVVFAPFPNSITTEEYIANQEKLDFNQEKYLKGDEGLQFYEIRDYFVSPILTGTTAPTLGIFSSDYGYETIVRALADARLTSKKMIPIRLGKTIDGYSLSDLQNFDGLLLYDYRYENKEKAFNLINKYLEKGKNVFVDTGVENPESKTSNLPKVFPIEATVRTFLKDMWNFEVVDNSLFNGVDINQFSPPTLDTTGWNFSYPKDENLVREGSQVIIKNHGFPLMISKKVGTGKIIWSGFNLPYHISRFHNRDEAVFFYNILNSMLDVDAERSIPSGEAKFIDSRNRMISVDGANGVLFKEHAYPGWEANVKNGNKNSSRLRIWKAGPSDEGFMYVRLPSNSKTTVQFSYKGSMKAWVFFGISMLTVIFITEEAVFGGVIIGKIRKRLTAKLRKRLNVWWAKEDED